MVLRLWLTLLLLLLQCHDAARNRLARFQRHALLLLLLLRRLVVLQLMLLHCSSSTHHLTHQLLCFFV
jgi:hypothetical protein